MHSVSQNVCRQMAGWQWTMTWYHVEGSGHALIWGTIPALRKTSVSGQLMYWPRFGQSTSQMQVRSVYCFSQLVRWTSQSVSRLHSVDDRMINECGAISGMRIGSSANLSTTNPTSLNLGSYPGCCSGKPPALQHGQSSVSQHNLGDISLHASCNLFHFLGWVVASINFRRKMICEPHKMTCMGINLINWVHQKCHRHFLLKIL
jgi:hypothetical protein